MIPERVDPSLFILIKNSPGLYDDGTPGEFFIKMNKEGSTLSGIMDSLALSISLNLQYGVPIEVLVSKFTHSRFEPAGMTSNKEIPIVKSIMDYIGRWMALKFLERKEAEKYHNNELIERAYSEGTMSGTGVMPTIRNKVSLGDLQVKTLEEKSENNEGNLIAVLEKSKVKPVKKAVAVAVSAGAINQTFSAPVTFQAEDATFCNSDGSMMIRNGSCHKCPTCGETSGCS